MLFQSMTTFFFPHSFKNAELGHCLRAAHSDSVIEGNLIKNPFIKRWLELIGKSTRDIAVSKASKKSNC